MTSRVTVGRARSSFMSTTALPRVEVDGELRLLVVGDESEGRLADLRRITPEPAVDTAQLGAEPTGIAYDAVLVSCSHDDSEMWDHVKSVVRSAGFVPVVAIVAAPASHKRKLTTELRSAGVTEVVLATEVTPALLEASIRHGMDKSKLENELLGLRDRFALAIRGALDGMWEWDLVKNKVFYSQRWHELLGLSHGDLGDGLDDWFDRVHPGDLQGVRAELDAHLAGRTSSFQNEHRIRTGTGEYRWVLARGLAQRDKSANAVRVSGSITDITNYRDRERDVREQSRHDAVTALPRQQVFHERLARAVEIRKSYNDYGFAVLMVQIDRFGLIRDSFGQEGADDVLGQISGRIQDCVTQDEVVARYGEDKLAILMENLEDPSEGTGVADKIHRAFEAPFVVGEQRVYVTVSIGMTSSARDYATVDDLITDVSAAADHARESRKQGEGRHQVFNTSMRIEALTLLQLEIAMREALERNEFQLHYQPVVQVETGKLVGFEALMRWHSATRGRVSPGEFIPVAENTGLIVPIGRWVIREAATQLKTWHEEFDIQGQLSLNVNLSGRQVGDPELLSTLQTALTETGVKPSCLKLELTESVLMENAEFAIELIQKLRSTGVKIYVDDFGTGYSSLSYLHRFPVDGLKIDKSFVDELDGTAPSGVMIKTILEMAQNLGLDVVAEGIEEEAQRAQLHGLTCPHGQGYLWAAPLSPGDAYAEIARSFG